MQPLSSLDRANRKAALFSSIALAGAVGLPGLALADQTTAAIDATATADSTAASESAAAVTAVVVTARHQAENAQDVPIAIAALPAKVLTQTNAYTLADVQNLVPDLVAYQSNARNSSLGIRGIGVSSASDGLDTTIGVYVDGVYLGRPGMALEDLADVAQVEVLRGPQGTLFGRNSAGGVVNITTEAPSFTPNLTLEGSYGNYNFEQVKASVTGPILDGVLAGRLTVFDTQRDGVLPNTLNGLSDNSIGRDGVRLQFLYTPLPKLSVRVIADYSAENDTCCVSVVKSVLSPSISKSTASTLTAFADLGYVPVASTNYTQINAPQDMLTDQHGVSVEADYDLGWAKLTSISAYRFWHFDPLQDSDGTPLDILQVNVAQTKDDQYTQEFRITSGPGRLSWQAGVFLFGEHLFDHYILNQFGYSAGPFYTQYLHLQNGASLTPGVSIAAGSQYIGDTKVTEESDAAFAQANYKILDNLILTAGVRYTYDFKHGETNTYDIGTPYTTTSIQFYDNAGVAESNVSYLASLSYKVTPSVMAYISYSTGYQSAGINLNAAPVGTNPIVLAPENVTDLEGGVKSTFFNDSLLINFDVFSEYLTGLQANVTPPGSKSYLANVGDIESRGVEAEGVWTPLEGLTLSANGSYDDAYYTSYPNAPPPVGVAGAPSSQNLTGRPVFQAPKWVANALGRYEWSVANNVAPYVQVQYTYRSSVFGDVQDSPGAVISGYSLVNARVGARFGQRYDLALWVENAFNKVYFQNLGGTSIPGAGTWAFTGALGAPRTFGATLRASF
jgi:iron complex outermembrane receptor protein